MVDVSEIRRKKKKETSKGKYYVVFKIDEFILGYISDEVHKDFASADKARQERIRVTGIEGELDGHYDVIYHEGNIDDILAK